jgi:hypothetical protein
MGPSPSEILELACRRHPPMMLIGPRSPVSLSCPFSRSGPPRRCIAAVPIKRFDRGFNLRRACPITRNCVERQDPRSET